MVSILPDIFYWLLLSVPIIHNFNNSTYCIIGDVSYKKTTFELSLYDVRSKLQGVGITRPLNTTLVCHHLQSMPTTNLGKDATLPCNPATMEWSPPLKQHYSIADHSEIFWI